MTKIDVIGIKLEVTDQIQNKVESTFKKLIKKEGNGYNFSRVEVKIKTEKGNHIAECLAHVSGMPNIKAKADSDDMYKTISLLKDKVESQYDKFKVNLKGKDSIKNID